MQTEVSRRGSQEYLFEEVTTEQTLERSKRLGIKNKQTG